MRNVKIILMEILLILTISCATTGQVKTADLLQATVSGDIDEVRKLMRAGVDVNTADEWGVTALMVAAMKGYSEIAHLLIDKGADVDRTCIHINAVTQVSMEASAKRLGPSITVLFVPPENPDPTTALMVAATFGKIEVTHLLINAGADVDLKDGSGCTALYIASRDEHLEIVRLLVTAGANVNSSTTDGATALMYAAYRGNTEIARLLIEAGADVNARDVEGYTALVIASDSGNQEIVRMLKQAGVKE